LRTRFLWRKVIAVKRTFFLLVLLFLIAACSRLDPLTPAVLSAQQEKWKSHQPGFYRLVVEMSGDRVETGAFEVLVRSGEVVSLRRNGIVVKPERDQDYAMDGLFRMLQQELGLAERPAVLGAPGGYSVYTLANFDEETGRLIHYRRTVGGTSNSIEIKVTEFEKQSE
jgi:hypothetical protein